MNPKPSQTSVYIGLEMNARGVLYDYLMIDTKYVFKRFNLQGVLLATYLRGTLNARGDQGPGLEPRSRHPVGQFRRALQAPESRRRLDRELESLGRRRARPAPQHVV